MRGSRTITVLLDDEFKNEALDRIVDSIGMVKGVAKVTAQPVDHATWMHVETARMALEKKLWDALYSEKK